MSPESERLLAEVLLSLKFIEADICIIKASIEGHPGTSQGWLRSADAAIALKSEGVLNARYLRKLLRDGVFSVQKGEIRDVSQGDRPTWEYNIPKCRKALQRHFRGVKSVF